MLQGLLLVGVACESRVTFRTQELRRVVLVRGASKCRLDAGEASANG